MKTDNIVHLHAQPVVLPFTVPAAVREMPALVEQMQSVPVYIGYVLDLILSDFDYVSNPDANTAKAIRILGVMVDRLNTALEQSLTLQNYG